MAPTTWAKRCREHHRSALCKKDEFGILPYSFIEGRWVSAPRCRVSLDEILERPSTLEDAQSMDRVAAEEKVAAKAQAADHSRSHEVRIQMWEHVPRIRTQTV